MKDFMPWTDERVALLTKFWEAGNSASEIAQALGGTTRQAVIGKLDRMGLKLRGASYTPTRPPSRAQAAPLAMRPAAWSPLPGVAPVSILDLQRHHCRWPVEIAWADLPHSCGARIADGRYCAHHGDISRAQVAPAKPKDLMRLLRRVA